MNWTINKTPENEYSCLIPCLGCKLSDKPKQGQQAVQQQAAQQGQQAAQQQAAQQQAAQQGQQAAQQQAAQQV